MKKICAFAAAVLTLAACSKNENPSPAENLKIAINPEILASKVTGVLFDQNDKIGLDVAIDGEASPFLTNAEMTYSGSSFTAPDLLWYQDVAKTSVLTAYYPYSASGRPATWTVQADQSTGTVSSDILGAVLTGAKPTANPVLMTFKHMLAKINVTINNSSSKTIQSVSVKDICAAAALDFTTLTSSAADGAATSEIKAYKTGTDTYELIVPAQSGTFTASVEMTDATVMDREALPITLVSGKAHTMEIDITEQNISVKISGDIEDWTEGEGFSFPTVEYAGVTYKTVTLSNGQTWMAEPLRYVPDGKVATNNPNDGNGIWLPYKVVEGVATALTDEESIAKYGYLYDYPTALGTTVTADNYSSFEGARGICPEGWHLPTRAEFLAICGYSNAPVGGSVVTDNKALFWDLTANVNGGYATIVKANEAGFNFTFSGSTQKNNVEATGKYITTVINATTTDVEEFVGEVGMTYLLGSTPYQWKTATAPAIAYAQFFGMMSTFNSSYKKGRLSVAYTNERAGYSIRCIKDGWTAK